MLPHQVILVQGSTGNTGLATIKALLNHSHPCTIKAGVRDLSKVDRLVALGADVNIVHLDTQYPQTVHAAFNGVTKLMLYPPNTEDRLKVTKLLVQAAVDSGSVKHIAMISVVGADKCAIPLQKQCYSMELLLERCGLPFTVIRCPMFMETFYHFALQLVQGHVRLPLHAGSTVMVATNDVGECAAVVLGSRDAIHHGKCYNITGPELLDGNRMAVALSEGLDVPIRYTSISDDEAYNMFLSVGFTPWQASGFIELFQLLSSGAGEFVSQDSECLLNRPPKTLAIWTREHILTILEYTRTAPLGQNQQHTKRDVSLSITQLTNGQGQHSVNEQGQQGAVYTWQEPVDRQPLPSVSR